jgi:hypothetical protein
MRRRTKTNRRTRSVVAKASASSSAPKTALELAKRLGLLGKAKHLPSDLSTNTAHMERLAKPKLGLARSSFTSAIAW